ncbi:hypothetical protein RSM15_004311 [Citrobacter freundii]|nr:hypothetical protein [Citrobacter freundii]
MGSNIIELSKLGHERAAELKASCGAVDVRSLAQLISDLATQLEVQLVRGNEQAVQLANAESKYRELAAENATKHEFIAICFRAVADGGSMDGADIQELGERLGLFGRETYQPVLHGYICGHEAGEDTVYVMKKTPATDAFLAEVRAQGVDMLSEKFGGGTLLSDMVKETAKEFASQLRKGAAL